MTLSEPIQSKVGTVVGKIAIRKPQVYTDRGYECAAWWEERTSITGIFPLTLVYDARNERLTVNADVPAHVSDDYFPALFAGNSFGTRPTAKQHVGEARTIQMACDMVDAIKNTGWGYGGARPDVEWFVGKEFWSIAVEHHTQRLHRAYNDLPRWWSEYVAGEDEYFSRVGMVAYFGKIIAESGEILRELQERIQRTETSTFLPLYHANTAWARTESEVAKTIGT